ncbi:MAG: quinone-dependent dihydroorotate dehydrogenase [Hyphomicrobiales bacterium]|nr:quinone-dependent dihydroorotate dehydrogenase [Hyphomicrobiales bacterium]
MSAGDRATRLLRLLDPELAHKLTIAALKRRRLKPLDREGDPRLALQLFGLTFASPVGLAAGFDKNGEVPDAMLRLGFSFVEIGTVTPQPQRGNPKPRIFRLPADGAVINRLGFNNLGHDAVARNLERRRGRGGLVGVNIGANKDSEDRIGDYVAGVARFAPLASWLTVNISSPNTPGLRDLQEAGELGALLGRVMEAREAAVVAAGRRVPLFVKISPDMDDGQLTALLETTLRHQVDGLIIANTTIARPPMKSRQHQQLGGLSGRPLFNPSTAMLARARALVGDRLVLIGVGGVDGAGTAWAKIAAGADLIQLYTGMIYQGPSLPERIKAGLIDRLEGRNFSHISQARGIETERWAAAWPRQVETPGAPASPKVSGSRTRKRKRSEKPRTPKKTSSAAHRP